MAFCSECASPIPQGARFCSNCGQAVNGAPAAAPLAPIARDPGIAPSPTAQPSRGGAGLILPLMLLAAVLVIGIVFWTQRDGARPIAGETGKPAAPADGAGATQGETASPGKAPSDPASVTAAALDSAFTVDPQGARQRYAGPLSVSGTIATMVTPGAGASLSLEGRTRFNFVVANFGSGSPAQFATLAKGDRVTLACRTATNLAGTTMLQGCAFD